MAENFDSARGVGTTSYVTIYTVPAGKTALGLLCQMTNINSSAAQAASVQWLDSSASNAATRLVEAISIPVGSAINAISAGGKLVLAAGDQLQVKCGTASQVEFSFSYLERS